MTHVGVSLSHQGPPADSDPVCMAKQWFAVQVAPQHEMRVASRLAHKGHEQFVPTQKVIRQWSDRTKVLERPLFPNYVFCRVQPTALKTVLTTLGVVRIVSFGGSPCPVRDDEIVAIQRITSSACEVVAVTKPKIGTHVRVLDGPLKGITGILTQIKNRNHVVVCIETIMKSVAVVVDAEMLTLATGTEL